MAFLTAARVRRLATTAAVCLCVGRFTAAQPGTPIEASVKAVYLYNFVKYVSWPKTERAASEVRICVAADDAIFTQLQAAVQGETIDGRALQPVSLGGLDEAAACHILYVGDSHSLDARAWLTAVKGRQVLTVADGALNDDTVIAFVRDDNRIRFDISRASANRRGITVSSKLLRLARQVKDQ